MTAELEDYDGADVVDVHGETIGSVDRTYDDDQGRTRFVEVIMGVFSPEHRLVPTDRSALADGTLHIPYSRQEITDSPDAASAGDTVPDDLLDAVSAYYDRVQGVVIADETAEVTSVASPESTEPIAGSDTQFGQVRDRGDVIEIPIVEEQLVKRRVVKEVLRIRKKSVTHTEVVGADIRKEDVEVTPGGDVVTKENDPTES